MYLAKNTALWKSAATGESDFVNFLKGFAAMKARRLPIKTLCL
jgi:hypothetical protein